MARVSPELDRLEIEEAAVLLLKAIGEDPKREGLQETPRRFADWWIEFLDGEAPQITAFTTQSDQMVVVSGIGVWSLCEHHLLPFWCNIAVGYLTEDGLVLGLSKFARLARHVARRLQVQERLTDELADAIQGAARSEHVAVLCRGVHLCMAMRGVEVPATMTTTVVRGGFASNEATRAEFLRAVELGSTVRLTP